MQKPESTFEKLQKTGKHPKDKEVTMKWREGRKQEKAMESQKHIKVSAESRKRTPYNSRQQ